MDEGRSASGKTGGAAAVLDALARVAPGKETAFENLALFPLLGASDGAPDYVILDEALARGVLHIKEVSAGGSVPDLKVTNEGDRRVFLLDGEELVGAKQNRVLNLSILIPARCTVIIPVSCVEAGRWHDRTAEFSASPRTLFAASRAKKTAQVSAFMRATGQRRSDQSEVWRDIEEKALRMDAASPTGAMEAVFDRHAASLEEYVRAFAAVDGQVGAVFAINGEVVGGDLFDHPDTLRKLLPKLARSYALDALDARRGKAHAPRREEVEGFLGAIARAQAECFAAAGEGVDVRLTGDHLAGAALVADDRVIHLSAFRLDGEEASQARVSRASMRRRSRQGPGDAGEGGGSSRG